MIFPDNLLFKCESMSILKIVPNNAMEAVQPSLFSVGAEKNHSKMQ